MNAVEILQRQKMQLLEKVAPLVALHKKLYSNMDIESPMGMDEKELNSTIAALYSQINTIVVQIHKLNK